jgi:hypothetical protein
MMCEINKFNNDQKSYASGPKVLLQLTPKNSLWLEKKMTRTQTIKAQRGFPFGGNINPYLTRTGFMGGWLAVCD